MSPFSYPKRRLRKMVRDGEYAEAVRYGESVRESYEDDADYMFIMGGICYAVGDHARALPYFERAVQLSPRDIEVLKLKTNSHLGMKDREGAADCCRRILEIDPGDDEAAAILGGLGT
ncbi:Tetratricopeptide repeat protein [Nitrosopumilaceae archaeon]|nr:Tetratricopeptide repeat protein [Nitrosopumilaceae archaeon]